MNKPLGCTSQTVVSIIKRRLGLTKAGHAGSLDPLATGLLAVAIGSATKSASLVSDLDKEYIAHLRLGFATTTDDAAGQPFDVQRVVQPSSVRIEKALESFRGSILQTPPPFSAVKLNGVRAYKKARKNIDFHLPQRRVRIERLQLLPAQPWTPLTSQGQDQPSSEVVQLCADFDFPIISLQINCSKGTYIRSLARDIGAALGCQGHLAGLCRTAIGHNRLENAADLDSITLADRLSVAQATGLSAMVLPENLWQQLQANKNLPCSDCAVSDAFVVITNPVGSEKAVLQKKADIWSVWAKLG